MYDMDMRQYDPAIARWVVLDPVIHHSLSPYNAFDNNPVFWADPSGANSESGESPKGANDTPSNTNLMGGIGLDSTMSVDFISYTGYGSSPSNSKSSSSNNSSSRNSNGSNSADSGDPDAILLDEVTIINGDYEGAMMKGVKQAVSYINGFNRLGSKNYRGSWGIGPLDRLTESISKFYNSWELYASEDNHVLWGPQVALEAKIKGLGVGATWGENLVEDNIQAPGTPGTMYRDEIGITAGAFGVEFINQKNAVEGSIISSSNSIGIGPITISGNQDGKLSISTGASIRAGLGMIGIKLGGEIGIRQK